MNCKKPRSESQKELRLLSSRRKQHTVCTKWSFRWIKATILSHLRLNSPRDERLDQLRRYPNQTGARPQTRPHTLRPLPASNSVPAVMLTLNPPSSPCSLDEATPLCRYDQAMQGHTIAQLQRTVRAIQKKGVEPEPCAGYRLAEVLHLHQQNKKTRAAVADYHGRPRLLLLPTSNPQVSPQAKRVEPPDEDGYFVDWEPPGLIKG